MVNQVYSASPERYESGMKYNRCGNSGVYMPAISLGLWHNFGDVNTLDNARKIVHYAFDNGVNHIDLANNYGPSYGSAEETFGQIMRSSMKPYRDELFISTKAGHDMWPGSYGIGSSRKHLIASLDQSLKRMGLEYVDLFYSHVYNLDTPIEETMQALVDIVHSGKALYIGLSKYPGEVAAKCCEYLSQRDVPCLIYQDRYNMLDRAMEQNDKLSNLAENGIGFAAFSPLAQGLLTERYLDGIVPADSRMAIGKFLRQDMLKPELLEKLRKLSDLAAQAGMNLAQMSLAWLLGRKGLTTVLVGARNVKQLSQNIKPISSEPLSEDLILKIESILGY